MLTLLEKQAANKFKDKPDCLNELGKNLSIESLRFLATVSSKPGIEKKLEQAKMFI